jgi:hypothetical protein
MTSPNREHLLGYILGALEPAELAAVERELASCPELAAELDSLRLRISRLGLTDEPQAYEPPAGLAARTCHFVALEANHLARPARAAFTAPPPADYLDSRGFSWADLLVAASVLIAGFALFFPALSHSRFQAQVALCQNHVRQLGMGLHEYATLDPMHWFPRIEREGNRGVAGAYAPILVGHGLVLDPRTFVCPSSDLAANLERLRIPSLEQLDLANGPELIEYHEVMGGDYGFNMGYEQGGELLPACDSRRPNHVLLADAPRDGRPGRTTANHAGCGQNLLYEDGCVKWLPSVPAAVLADDPFHNRRGKVAAGLDCEDAVIGASPDRPLPVRLIKE